MSTVYNHGFMRQWKHYQTGHNKGTNGQGLICYPQSYSLYYKYHFQYIYASEIFLHVLVNLIVNLFQLNYIFSVFLYSRDIGKALPLKT